ncbi:MAG TPA: hypothetical protein DCE81_14010 [Cytophagales bacterium]|nr:hypothetical protein [Cytophagales bacterium]
MRIKDVRCAMFKTERWAAAIIVDRNSTKAKSLLYKSLYKAKLLEKEKRRLQHALKKKRKRYKYKHA